MRIKTLSPTKGAILVCATIGAVVLLGVPQTEAFSVNFVYNDLLAHPQYDVQFLKEVVPASFVTSRPNTHRRKQRHGQAQIETTKSETQDREQQQETIHESPSTVVMTDADGMRWSCMIPPKLVHEVKASPQLTPQEIKEEERRSIQRGLELLDHLSLPCLYMKRDFWTYEYCHKRSIRQYHAIQSNGQWVPDTPANTYVLAKYQSEKINNDQAQTSNEAALQQRSPSSSVVESTATTTELEVSNERKYLVQRWENGDICKETGQPRKVEVQFQCAPFGDRIQVVMEPSICNYIMVIYSPNLCKDPAFESVPTPEANKIECRGIVSDEQYLKLKANVPEAIDGAAGIFQDHNAQIKIGQVPRQQSHQHQTQQDGAAAAGEAGKDSQPTVFTTLEDILGFAKQANDINAQKQLEEVLAQYEALSENLKAMMSPEDRAVYERFENMLIGKDSGHLDELSKEEQEKAKNDRDFIDAIFGSTEEVEASAEHEKKLKQKTKDGQEVTAAANKEQQGHLNNIKFATIDAPTLLEILKVIRNADTTTNANTAEEKQKQGRGKSEETKEKKSDAQAKL
ncbi:Protein OS-9 [Linnemannia schmuckeri]|uniref:Protein OS-9 homolog n=1 Tax=Linnemannia schmuckeri TaxID=64567 RepID=A0A9P5S4Z2_9FUNG|nr:Protein OS-9 [Linnemannia schmuckeri]